MVWLGVVSSRPRTHPVPYLRPAFVLGYPQDPRGCTAMHFGENQLSPGSIGISPLPTGHPHALQRTWVRAFTVCYHRCTLPMGSSPGFGSTPTDSSPSSDSPSLRLQRACALASPVNSHSPDHATKGTPSSRPKPHGWDHRPLTAGTQAVSGSVSFPSRGAFHLSLTVLVHYRSPTVF